MKHKHYEMIVAKAANMDLVVFAQDGTTPCSSAWFEITQEANKAVNFHSGCNYFLCLPKHKEACLHWLNGGDIQVRDFVTSPFSDCCWSKEWSIDDCGFMVEDWVIRIKPKKEKRWIVWDTAKRAPEEYSYESLEAAKLEFDYPDAQYIEIEVEV